MVATRGVWGRAQACARWAALSALVACGGGDDDDGDPSPGSTPNAGTSAAGSAGVTGGAGGAGGTAVSAGSSAGSGTAGGAGMGGSGGSTAEQAIPLADGKGVEYRGIVNLVDAEAAGVLDEFLITTTRFTSDSKADLQPLVSLFYDHYGDDYDFLIFLNDHPVESKAAGVHHAMNVPPLQGTGQDSPQTAGINAPPHLRAVIGIELDDFERFPPFAHEIAHNWGNHLDPKLGFFDPSQPDYGGHWGVTGVNGQLGGFDPASLRCETPAGQSPPNCTAGANGRTRFLVNPFHPAADFIEGMPFGPLELYLMGLIPVGEVPDPILRFEDTNFDLDKPELSADRKFVVEAARIGEIKRADIVARHGSVRMLAADKRHFRIALVLISKAPAQQRYLDAVADWGAIFAAELKSNNPNWKSFAELTGNRATLSYRLGARRMPDGEYQDWRSIWYDECRPERASTDCGNGMGCYGIGGFYCARAGSGASGDACESDIDCAPGLICNFVPTSLDDQVCAPYCDPVNDAAPNACKTLCPSSSSPILHTVTLETVGAFCGGNSGGVCDPLAQDCGPGQACSGQELTTCDTHGDKLRGEMCFPFGAVCEPGTVCIGIEGMDSYCQPYCNPAAGAPAEIACATLCPGGAWPYGSYSICIPDR